MSYADTKPTIVSLPPIVAATQPATGALGQVWINTTTNTPMFWDGAAWKAIAAAGGLWRKINSTYGSTIFFGKGDYNPADTSAAANWGMPAGTYPSGQQPLNGDSYYDVTSGTKAIPVGAFKE
jgi:hypothetical protein